MAKLPTGFGERLTYERKRLGLSQGDFAEKVGLKRITQHFYEKEQNYPNYNYFNDCNDIGVDISYLLFAKRKPEHGVELTLDMLKKIFSVVDEKGRNSKGDPLSLEQRLEFFTILCASVTGKTEEESNFDNIVNLFSRKK